MKWFLVLVSMQLYADGTAEHFVLTDPTFGSLGEWQASAYFNKQIVAELAQNKLGGPAKIYCFSEESLRAYLNLESIPTPAKKQQISY